MRWLKSLRKGGRQELEFDRELQFHLEESVREKIAQDISPTEARRQALLEFGGKEQATQGLRDVHSVALLERARANLKSGLRLIRRAPGFSAAVILTLALGIGANSAVFSAIDAAVLLRPLPFPHADELMLLQQNNSRLKEPTSFVAPVRLEDWNRMNSTFQAMTGYYTEDASETSGELPEKVTIAFVAPRFLQVWGVAPFVGRDFSPEEEKFGGPNAVLISGSFWNRRFHADPNIVGKTVRLGRSAYTVVGVMPASFRFLVHDAELWSPIPTDSPYAQDRQSTWYTVIGRLKPGVAVAQARADLATVQEQLGHQYPKTDSDLSVTVVPLKEHTIGSASRSLWMLYGSVTLLLLIACTNIAALLLARTTEREHEISIRFSLGASRASLVWQLLTETLVLALAGSATGLVLATVAARVFRNLAGNLPRVEEIALDWRIAGYTFACGLLVTLLCGIIPALHATRGLSGSLARGSRAQVSARSPLQWGLVATQVALAVMLLFGAGLLLRSFQQLGRVSAGFDPEHILTLHISASYGETVDMKALSQRINRILDAVRNVPGVESAATASTLPGVPNKFETELRIVEGQQDPDRKVIADSRFVSPGYFSVMRIPLLTGEPCADESDAKGMVVNRDFANHYFADSSALRHHLAVADAAFPLSGEIRGIAASAREQGLNTAPMPTVYWCMSAPVPDPYYLIRTRTDPMAMSNTVRRVIHQLEPGRSVFDIMPLTDHLHDAFAENRMRTILLSLFAITALSLACVGLYGTLSYVIMLRNREIGLRLAIGAQRSQILMRYLVQGMRITILGCACGLVLAALSARFLAGMLFGVSRFDLVTLSGVVGCLLLVAASACLIPSLRASRTDPMRVLREQ